MVGTSLAAALGKLLIIFFLDREDQHKYLLPLATLMIVL